MPHLTNKELEQRAKNAPISGAVITKHDKGIFEEAYHKGLKWYRDNYDPWFYVEDGDLPDPNQEIFALLDVLQEGYFPCKIMYKGENDWEYDENWSFKNQNIKCWMPIPEPKK